MHNKPDRFLIKWLYQVVFNIFIGFLGYSLRFWSIPRLPTAFFSILTFIGVAAGYGWGLMYAKEVPSKGALFGAGLITGALALLRGKN
jgi:drug/metabolite transporter (DMT)-like permease